MAQAQKPLELAKLFVGYPAGGATDTVARLVAEAVQGKYADAVIVENRPGAGGQIAAMHVKGQPPDGAALLFTPAFPMIIHPHVYKELRYDTLKDFVPVATTHFGTLALSVGPGTPDDVKTLKDFIAWAKAQSRQGKLRRAGRRLAALHRPDARARRGHQAAARLLSRRRAVGHRRARRACAGDRHAARRGPAARARGQAAHPGDDRARALDARARHSDLLRAGVREDRGAGLVGFLAPAGTPPEVIARANAAISAAVESAKVKEAMAKLGMEVGTRTPAAFAETVRESWERYRDIVKASGFQAEQ